MFQIIKKTTGWWHVFNSGAKSQNISDFEVTIDDVANTFVIVQRNGSNIPLNKLTINEIEVINETDASVVETFTNVVDLKARLEELEYTAYVKGATGSFQTADSKEIQVVNGLITSITII